MRLEGSFEKINAKLQLCRNLTHYRRSLKGSKWELHKHQFLSKKLQNLIDSNIVLKTEEGFFLDNPIKLEFLLNMSADNLMSCSFHDIEMSSHQVHLIIISCAIKLGCFAVHLSRWGKKIGVSQNIIFDVQLCEVCTTLGIGIVHLPRWGVNQSIMYRGQGSQHLSYLQSK